MGFHLKCSGADLLKHLNKDAYKFLDAPYGLYIVALASYIDDDVLEWIIKYEMALDSITGHFAAFLLFYNEASLNTTPYFKDKYPHYDRNLKEEIPVDGGTLRKGENVLDDFINHRSAERYYPEMMTDKKFLIRSMTYESDKVARELGILDKLPCLLFIEDPKSSEYHLLPLDKPDFDTIHEIRQLLGQFFNEPKNSDFFKAIKMWHRFNDSRIEAIKATVYLESSYHYPEINYDSRHVYDNLKEAKEMLLSGRAKDFRKVMNKFEGAFAISKEIDWKFLRNSSNLIAVAKRLEQKIHQANSTPNSTNEVESQTENYIKLQAQKILGKPDYVFQTMSLDNIAKSLSEFVINETQNTMQKIFKNIIFSWETIEIANESMDDLMDIIEKLEKPSFNSYLKNLMLEKKRNSLIQSFKRNVIKASEKAPSLFDILDKGIKLIT